MRGGEALKTNGARWCLLLGSVSVQWYLKNFDKRILIRKGQLCILHNRQAKHRHILARPSSSLLLPIFLITDHRPYPPERGGEMGSKKNMLVHSRARRKKPGLGVLALVLRQHIRVVEDETSDSKYNFVLGRLAQITLRFLPLLRFEKLGGGRGRLRLGARCYATVVCPALLHVVRVMFCGGS